MYEDHCSIFQSENQDISLKKAVLHKKAICGFTAEEIGAIIKKSSAGENLTAKEAAASYAKKHGVSIEKARATVGAFAVNDAELSEKGQEAFRRFVKARDALDTIAGAKTGFVVTKANDTFHAAAKDGKLYIGADSFENGTWKRDLIHEYTHFAEGSAEYAKLAKFLIDEDLTVDTKNGKQTLYSIAVDAVLGKGYVSAEALSEILAKQEAGKTLTAEESKTNALFYDELMAHATEHLLGNEAFIDKLVAKDAPLARKAFDKIVEVCKAIGGNAASKTLRTAQKLYIKAAEQSGNTRLAKYFLSHAPEIEEEESLDSESEVQYNRKVVKKTFYFQHENFPGKEPWREAHRLAIWWAKHDDVETGEQTLISMNDVWYVVEKFDDADNGYQVEERLTAAEYKSVRKEIDEYGRSGQIKSVQESTDFIDLLDQSGGSFEGRGSSADRIQPQHGRENQQIQQVGESSLEGRERPGGDEQGNRSSSSVHRQGQNVKFSLKDSAGAVLTEAQAEYFKDSRVRDKDGKLLVMYQGAAEEFYTFDRKKSKPSNLYGRGFYFTNSEDQARHYGNTRAYYLGVNNPVSVNEKTITRSQMRKFLEAVAENEDYSIENYGTYDVGEVLASVYQGKTDFAMLQDVSATAIGDLVEAVELFNEINGTSYDGIILDTEVVTFRSEQAKLTTNKTPTRNPDIRFSLKSSTDNAHSEEAERHRADAIEAFGTTTDFKAAGYVLSNGQMLNIGTPRSPQRHLSIAKVLPGVERDSAISTFLSEGNVRIAADSPGVEISSAAALTSSQYNTLSRFVSAMRDKGRFYVDFVNESGEDLGSLSYYDDVSAYRIINDIKLFFETGRVPRQSDVRFSKKYQSAEENGEILSLIEKINDGAFKDNDKVLLGSVSPLIAPKIQELTGFDVRDFKIAIEARQLKHILKDHGKNGLTDRSMADPSDIAKMQYVLESPGDISYAGKTQAYTYTANGRNKTADTVLYEKEIGEKSYYVVQAVPDTKAKTLYIVTAFIGKKGYKKEASQLINAKNPDATPENGSAITSSTDSIAQERDSVKRKKSTARFSLKSPDPSDATYKVSDGQVKKMVANYTRLKTYTKAEADEVIHEILTNAFYSEDEHATLRGKSREELVNMLWQGMNTAKPGKRGSVALKVADYVIEHAMLEHVLDVNLQIDTEIVSILRPYLRKLELDSLRDEIAHRFDDKTGGVYNRWRAREGEQGLPVDAVKAELAEKGFTIEDEHPADIFFSIATAYENAKENLDATKQTLKSAIEAEELRTLRQDIASRVLRAFDEKGSASALSKYIDEQRKKLRNINKTWKERFREEHNRTYYGNRVLHKLRKLKDLKTGAFLNASQYKTDTFKGSIEQLSRIEHRGNLNKSSSRKILAGLAEWYRLGDGNLVITKENYDEGIAATLEVLSKGDGEFTADELLALENVLDYFTHFVQNWGKVYRDGKYVEAKPLAEMYRDGIIRNNRAKVGWLRKCFEKYYRHFGDPAALMRYMDAYDPNGFYTTMFLKLRDGLTKAQILELEMREGLEAFYKEHKTFLTDIQEKTIDYRGQKIPIAQAMLLYMTFNRDQALRGLAYSGFSYFDGGDVVSVEGFAEFASDLALDELRLRARLEQQAIAAQFTEVEKEYISIVEKLFNVDCKQAKHDTDMLLRGYSNAIESYYVPIRRGNIAKGVEDSVSFFEELDRVSNASFNKDTVKNAKNELFIEGLERVIDCHVRAVSMYSNLALVLNEYDVLYNLDIGGNPNKTVTIGKAAVNSIFSKTARRKDANGTNPDDAANEYFKKLIADIQGVSVKRDAWDRVLGKLRGSFAKFQLGANPKVWLTQLSSFLASTSILDYASVVKGFGISGADVDKYCPLAKLRNHENTAALAQGVIEKTDKLGDVLMAPIGKVDRLVIRKLFAACQVQVEADGGPKVGTEENKVKAGELLTKVIFETQQNSLATERSAAMRHQNELVKTLTMFSADAMKIVGRTVDAIGELATLKKKRTQATDQAEIEALDAAIKKAGKRARKSVGALIGTSVFMALIAQGFRFLYDKDDEDTVWTFLADVFGNLFGGLPLIRDIISRFTNGYDMEHYAYAAVNDLLAATVELGELSGDVISGKATAKEALKVTKDALYAGGALFGIPVRNVYNVVSGLSRRVGVDFNGALYEAESYRDRLESAIESGDEDQIAKIVGLMLDEKVGIEDDEVRREMAALVGQGFDSVIPSSVPSTITIDKVKYELDEKQKAAYEKVYNTSLEKVAKLVRLSSYESATPEAKAKAITTLYSLYRELAREAALDIDLETKGALFGTAFGDKTEVFALAVATASLLEADKDKKGKTIAGSRKAKVQKYVSRLNLTAVEKYMIMGYLGYTNVNGKAQVQAYIYRLGLTSGQKKKLLELCGYK